MLQRARVPGPRARARGGGDAGAAPDQQARLGNAAMQDRTASQGPSDAVSDAEAQSWISEAWPEGPGEEKRGPTRPSTLKSGMKGALIGDGAEIVLTRDAEGEQELTKVPDGTPARVTAVKEGRVEVEVRVGKEALTGWADGAVFSDQPGLTKDEDDASLSADYVYAEVEGDHRPVDPKGKDTAQGSAGDCYFIASMAAVANASPKAIEDAITYDEGKGTYTVRFYEEDRSGKMKPVYIEVDSWLPVAKDNPKDPVYAGDEGGKMWSAIMEKAYAEWKGGYDVLDEGGTGSTAMAEITGVRSQNKSPASMKEADVVPWFEQAQKDGKAIYAGVKDGREADAQKPFSGAAEGPYEGKVAQTHRWNEIIPGTVRITDTKGEAGDAWDVGTEGDKTGKIRGSGVASGTVGYKGDTASQLELTYAKGKGPAAAGDLEVSFEYEGVLDVDKFIIGNHAYAFEGVLDGKELRFYNPWGTYQPKPITPAEFLQHFDSLSVNQVPGGKTQA